MRGSLRVVSGHREGLSGHGVPLAELARRFADALEAGDPFALSRGLDLGDALADWIAARAQPAPRSADEPA